MISGWWIGANGWVSVEKFRKECLQKLGTIVQARHCMTVDRMLDDRRSSEIYGLLSTVRSRIVRDSEIDP